MAAPAPMTFAEVMEILYGMDSATAKQCLEAWHERNEIDGPEWENDYRYRAEFAAGFAAGRGLVPRATLAHESDGPRRPEAHA